MTDPRSTNRWRKLRAVMVARAQDCAMCGRPLIHNARARSRWSPSLDHILPMAHGGDPFAPGNLRVVHYGCNASKSARIRNGTYRHTTTADDNEQRQPTRCPSHEEEACTGWHSRAW